MEILSQADQWPDRCAKHDPEVVNSEVKRLRGEDTGLYGEDEDDLYDVYATPSPKGKGWDVLREVGH